MRPGAISFRAASVRPRGPDVAYAALPLLRRLADTLPPAARFRSACRAAARPTGVPPLFFFHRPHQAEWVAGRPRPENDVDRAAPRVAARLPDAAAAWSILPDLVDDAIAVLCGSAEARHAARAVPGLWTAADRMADDLPACRDLADLLAMPDDEIVRVRYPARGFEARVLVRGVATVAQFHVLLADELIGSHLPGRRPTVVAVDAARFGVPPGGDPVVARAAFQLLKPNAGPLDGFAAADQWLWGRELLSAVPRVDGERTVLLAPPAYPAEWEVTLRFPTVRPEVEVVELKSGSIALPAAA
jgi:hypothetical protein